ncbi:MAG: hypothetical protein M3320_04625 [Actinomycetota bacterium]|nr:hypothetical protein [Actinomycetota bacterium]MDQ5807940.1 hypothetical protein [Actinomycetota bacterium]
MSQVSLPMRIALVVTLAFSAIWMVVLKPKPPEAAPAPTPPAQTASPQSAPGKAAAQAQEAVGASQESAQQHEKAAGAVGSESATGSGPATAKPQAATKAEQAKTGPAAEIEKATSDKLSKPAQAVLTDLVEGKVAVLLFWDKRLSDDRAVHAAVKGLDRRGGKVGVHVAPIGDLAQFEPITRGVPVVTSPTVIVIDRTGKARSVGGLSVPGELEELVGKALRVKP